MNVEVVKLEIIIVKSEAGTSHPSSTTMSDILCVVCVLSHYSALLSLMADQGRGRMVLTESAFLHRINIKK